MGNETRRSSDSSGALEHEQPQGGAPVGNTNPQKKIQLPSWLDLTDPEGIRRFLREILVPSALSGKLGVRVVTAVTSICKTLLDSQQATILEELQKRLEILEKGRGDNRTQEEILAAFILQLPAELQGQVKEYADYQARLEDEGKL